MSDPKDHPFQPGVEVAVSTFRFGGNVWRKGKVAKVHKTGRFVLEGGDQQYRPCAPSTTGFGDKEWSARSTATGYSDGGNVYLMTPEYAEQIARCSRVAKGRAAISVINTVPGKFAPDFFTADVVADLERLAALAKGGKP